MSDIDVSKIDVGWRVQLDATTFNNDCKKLHGVWGTVTARDAYRIVVVDDVYSVGRHFTNAPFLAALPPEPVKDPFAVGEWVVCVETDYPVKSGDIVRVKEEHWNNPMDWFGVDYGEGSVMGVRKHCFRPATPEEIARHLGEEREGMEKKATDVIPTGGLSGHYLAEVPEPQRGGPSYTAECDDITFALNMTFDEGEAFKAIWRTCTSRLGYGKEGNTPLYNAQKLVHRARRILKRAEKGE